MRVWIVECTLHWNEHIEAVFSSREKAENYIQKQKMWVLAQGEEWGARGRYYELYDEDGLILDDPIVENKPWVLKTP